MKSSPTLLQKALTTLGLGFLFRGVSTYDQRSYMGGMGGQLASGGITELNALQISAVYACVRIISQNIGTLPLWLYKRSTDGKDKVKYPQHPLSPLIHSQPNREMSAATYWPMAIAHMLLWGNHYSLIDKLAGDPVAFWPLEPDRVRKVMRPDGTIYYEYQTASGIKEYSTEDVFHPKLFSLDGITGQSAIQMCRRTLQLSRAAEDYGSGFFKNGGRPSGVLKMKHELSEDGAKRLRASWEALHQGATNMGRVAILEQEMDYQAVSISPDDAQFLETRKFQVQDVCRIFGVPPHLVQEIDQPTYASVEAQKDEFLTFTLRPIMVAIEQELNLQFLGGQDSRYTAGFNFQGFLRSDVKTRYESYAIGRNWGWLSQNDIRALEDMNPIPDGDVYLQPLNMTPASGARAPVPDITLQPGQVGEPAPTPGVSPSPPKPKPVKPNGAAVQ
jgi:HK97 family phage portal protein